jgi:transposase
VKAIAWKAQHRLNQRCKALAGEGKNKNQAATALAREQLGFIGAIANHTDQRCGEKAVRPIAIRR